MATVKQLAALVGGKVVGDDSVDIRQVASADDVRDGEITFAVSGRYIEMVRNGPATAVLVGAQASDLIIPQIIVGDPRIAAIQIAAFFAPEIFPEQSIHAKAFVDPLATVDPTASILPGAFVGAGSMIGARSILMPGCVVMDNVVIGEKCFLHPHVVIGRRCVVGDRVIIHAGASIGADGFGYFPVGERHEKIPQLGIVEIGNDVEIGANSCVDRATVGRTTIGDGTKIDNLVQIAHNCHVGKNCILVSKVGLAGSARLGDNCVIGGGSGVLDNTSVGAGGMIGAMSGVISDLPAGSKVAGFPAVNHMEWKRTLAATKKLSQTTKQVGLLEKRLAKIESDQKKTERDDG
jgi:UDP-3-O-[3-hydroxymyristoyl] glucosamine N-acyltransferase